MSRLVSDGMLPPYMSIHVYPPAAFARVAVTMMISLLAKEELSIVVPALLRRWQPQAQWKQPSSVSRVLRFVLNISINGDQLSSFVDCTSAANLRHVCQLF